MKFCLVLRKVHDHYYEILDDAPKVDADFLQDPFPASAWLGPSLWLCMNWEDAAHLSLSIQRRRVSLHRGYEIQDERHSLLSNAYARPRMSSYAVTKTAEQALKIMGAISFDGTSIPCARCGGLFEPTPSMPADYAQYEGPSNRSFPQYW